jgi:hypothetical protein
LISCLSTAPKDSAREPKVLDDFRTAVPIQDYSAASPFAGRMAAGEHNVLGRTPRCGTG